MLRKFALASGLAVLCAGVAVGAQQQPATDTQRPEASQQQPAETRQPASGQQQDDQQARTTNQTIIV